MALARRAALGLAVLGVGAERRAVLAQPAGGLAAAIQMSVSPTLLELSREQRAAVVDVAAFGSDPIRVQIRLRRWTMRSARPAYEETDEIAVSPPQAIVQPGRSQTVRVVADAVPPDRIERAYRLFVNQLPAATADSRSRVALALEAVLPVFFAGQGTAPPRLQVSATRQADAIELLFRNEGDSHTRLTELAIRAGSTSVFQTTGLVGYVLARSETAVRVPLRASILGASAVLDVTGSKGASLRAVPLRLDG